MDWDHWRFFAAVAYSDDLRRYRFIHCVDDLLASLLYPHLLDEHARRIQAFGAHASGMGIFERNRGGRSQAIDA